MWGKVPNLGYSFVRHLPRKSFWESDRLDKVDSVEVEAINLSPLRIHFSSQVKKLDTFFNHIRTETYSEPFQMSKNELFREIL